MLRLDPQVTPLFLRLSKRVWLASLSHAIIRVLIWPLSWHRTLAQVIGMLLAFREGQTPHYLASCR